MQYFNSIGWGLEFSGKMIWEIEDNTALAIFNNIYELQAREVNCKELEYSNNDKADDDYEHEENKNAHDKSEDEEEEYEYDEHHTRRMIVEPGQLQVHTAGHYHDTRRKNAVPSGGFCEVFQA